MASCRPWPDPGPNFSGGYCCFPAGSVDDLSIVDVGGQRVVLIARHQPGSIAADKAELQGIIDSIAIEPAAGKPVAFGSFSDSLKASASGGPVTEPLPAGGSRA